MPPQWVCTAFEQNSSECIEMEGTPSRKLQSMLEPVRWKAMTTKGTAPRPCGGRAQEHRVNAALIVACGINRGAMGRLWPVILKMNPMSTITIQMDLIAGQTRGENAMQIKRNRIAFTQLSNCMSAT
eukprot:scaffold322473_cov28-Tisochrysis_lutea.AAC.2